MSRKWTIGWMSLAAVAALSLPGFSQGGLESAKAESGLRFGEFSGSPALSATPVDAAGGAERSSALSELTSGQPKTPALSLDHCAVPAPTLAPRDPNAEMKDRYGRIGSLVGSISLSVAGAVAGAVLGGPSVVGAAAAAFLFSYAGGKAGAVAGRAVGRAIATAKIAIGEFVAKTRQYLGAVGRWWSIRPRYGQPWP